MSALRLSLASNAGRAQSCRKRLIRALLKLGEEVAA
jgi:hypothetical protein